MFFNKKIPVSIMDTGILFILKLELLIQSLSNINSTSNSATYHRIVTNS